MAQPPSERPRGYRELLRENRDFRNLWLGQLTSFVGDWFNFIALYAAVQEVTTSGRAVALVMVAKMLPVFLITPVAGPIIDRFDRRRILIATDVARALCALGLVLAHQAGSLAGLYGCTIVMMLGTGIAVPTKSAVLPMIVPRREVAVANALSGGTWSAMLAIGATLGGIATELLGIDMSFLLDGATFVLSMMFFVRLPKLPPQRAEDVHTAGFVEGLRYLSRNRYIFALAMLKPAMQVSGGLIALIPFYGSGVFSGADGPIFVGILFAMRGVGAVIGSLVMRVLLGDRARTMRRAIAASFVLIGGSYAMLSLSVTYWQAVLAYFGAAVGSSTIWVFSGTLLQTEGDPAFHGRIFSVEFGLNTLMLGVSSYVAGAAIDLGYSFPEVALGLGSLSIIPLVMWTGVVIARERAASHSALSGAP